MNKSELDKIATKVVNAAFEVHKELGAGLLESVYHICLVKELKNRGLKVESEVRIPVVYKGETLSKDFYIDILVEDEIIIELKAVEIMLPVHEAQLISYLKLANKKLGFLLNFNVDLIKNGIKRRINGYFSEK
ncbi:MAG: GxxExxY protein [Bacteroidetes bacterium]|mgnify:CR=1 FL=1|jgi:GxxExxY protein|nr:GxxExxY protein [Bacteroidota bacterium]MBT5529212.1 GxxExxY protein [Cytophagia bacterium]MBT3424361.1 GxxExxY protein [Bacteroidota bacterium]MBT3801272.1 GxxExxY protein [Bacteroidota bacterium]MBT3932818.1 GxxExxY protein [Bacteroidota bacterium]